MRLLEYWIPRVFTLSSDPKFSDSPFLNPSPSLTEFNSNLIELLPGGGAIAWPGGISTATLKEENSDSKIKMTVGFMKIFINIILA